MTDRCDARRIQDYLDGEMPAGDATAFREHLVGCVSCAAELALYRRAFAALEMTLAPAPAMLVERVLDRVLPSRVRRRWVRTFGWAYAGVFAASLAAVGWWASQPAARSMLVGVADHLSKRVVEGLMFGLNAIAFLMVSLVNGWSLVNTASQRLAPFARALGALLSNSGIQITLVTAAASAVLLLWWIRPREKRETRGVRHVGVLGF